VLFYQKNGTFLPEPGRVIAVLKSLQKIMLQAAPLAELPPETVPGSTDSDNFSLLANAVLSHVEVDVFAQQDQLREEWFELRLLGQYVKREKGSQEWLGQYFADDLLKHQAW